MSYVLVVDDDARVPAATQELLARFGYGAQVVPTPFEAARQIRWRRPLVVLTNRRLPRENDRTLRTVCDCLAIPLLDLAMTVCLMGQKQPRIEGVPPEPLPPAR